MKAWALAVLVGSASAAGSSDVRTDEYSDKIRDVIDHPTVRSALGPVDTPIPLDLANFLLDHPDLAAFIVRRRHLAPYTIEMRGPRQSWADDGAGTSGLITLADRTDQRRVYYGEGVHRSRMFPDIRAFAVIGMDVEQTTGADCRPHVRSVFDVSLRLKNAFLAGLLKALRPFVRKTVTRIFSKAFLVASQVGRLTASDPDSVSRDADAFVSLSPRDRAEFGRMISALKTAKPSCP